MVLPKQIWKRKCESGGCIAYCSRSHSSLRPTPFVSYHCCRQCCPGNTELSPTSAAPKFWPHPSKAMEDMTQFNEKSLKSPALKTEDFSKISVVLVKHKMDLLKPFRAACLQNETPPEKLLNRYEKRFEKREKRSKKRSETRPTNV